MNRKKKDTSAAIRRHTRTHPHTPAPVPRHARTLPTLARARAPTRAWTPEDDHDRFWLGFLERLIFSTFQILKNF